MKMYEVLLTQKSLSNKKLSDGQRCEFEWSSVLGNLSLLSETPYRTDSHWNDWILPTKIHQAMINVTVTLGKAWQTTPIRNN